MHRLAQLSNFFQPVKCIVYGNLWASKQMCECRDIGYKCVFGLCSECMFCVVQALATACVACGPSQPAETKQATARVVEQLVLLVNPENDLDHIGTTGPVSFTHTLPCPVQVANCPALLYPALVLALFSPALPRTFSSLPSPVLPYPPLHCSVLP